MKKYIFAILTTLVFVFSLQASAYECTTSEGTSFQFRVLLQGRVLHWKYGVLTGEALGADATIGNPPGHWKNPNIPNNIYSLYVLTKLDSFPSRLLAIQYRQSMIVKDVILMNYSDGILVPVENLTCLTE